MELISQLASQGGLLGILLAISLTANVMLYRETRQLYKDKNDLQERRVEDAKQTVITVVQPQKEIQATLEKLVVLVEDHGRDK